MGLFSHTFKLTLEANEPPAPVEATPTAEPANDREAMANELDTAKPEDFDVKVAARQQEIDHVKNEQITRLKEWVVKIDDFITFLNGTETTSLQSQLHAAPCDTTFEQIATGEKKKISRLAADMSALSESLKGYLISYNNN